MNNPWAIRADPRTVLSEEGHGVLTAIQYLAPAEEAGIGNLCPDSTEGCRGPCLFFCGRGGMAKTQEARIRKTRALFEDRDSYLDAMDKGLVSLRRKAERESLTPAARPNGTTDLPWESMPDSDGRTLLTRNRDLTFYDYTKSVRRARQYLDGKLPCNYHLTLSRSERNDDACVDHLSRGGVVAAVYEGPEFPSTYFGYPVIPEVDDYRPADPPGSVVALLAKGAARKDTSGFVIRSQ